MNRTVSLLLMTLVSGAVIAEDNQGEEKHHEDPTRIVTKAGIGISDTVTLSGSLGLDDARMLSARISDNSEWRIGGSWLFDIGIVNFNFSKTDYDNDSYRNNYSVGTYVPLTYFDIQPAGWMLFPMAGYAYNDGKQAVPSDDIDGDYVLMRSSSHGGYLGMFGVRPIANTKWSVMSFGGAGAGSNSYSSHWVGAGVSYKVNDNLSFNSFGYYSSDDFGSLNKFSGSFTYQF
ncbi:hypothetical protein [Vibrio sp. WXL103]|uniref:hypothetical protein n=1 Tax=Vibrio sp. WXL103 TaxID=3450710 RepID=UPI003EC7166B